jgi:hypothetical protein
MDEKSPNIIVREHLGRFFIGHACNEYAWTLGPACEELPRLRIAEFAPGPRSALWVYATIGAWEACEDPRLKFVTVAPQQDQRHVELLTMSAWYHGRYGLATGHTFPIGEPWLPGSICEFFLVSKPYPFGPQLEVCICPNLHLHVLWLLPITGPEREYKAQRGLDAIEQQFDASGLEYWVPNRASIV